MNRRWVLATGNTAKVREIAELLRAAGHELDVVAQSELGVEPVAEHAATFVENALVKARHAARATGLPAIADDSGLCVDALDGAPGVRSARYAGDGADDRANVAKLLESLARVAPAQRGATFHCVLVACRTAADPAPIVAMGHWRGTIAAEPRGVNGFGYDPVFVDPSSGHTAAELSPERKNRASHRGRALMALAAALAEFERGHPTGP